MLRRNVLRLAVPACLILVLAACSGAAGEPGPDRVSTRVAEDLAVAHTLTAVAQNSNAPTQIAQVSTPIVAASAMPVPSPTPIPPTDTPLPPTAAPAHDGLFNKVTHWSIRRSVPLPRSSGVC